MSIRDRWVLLVPTKGAHGFPAARHPMQELGCRFCTYMCSKQHSSWCGSRAAATSLHTPYIIHPHSSVFQRLTTWHTESGFSWRQHRADPWHLAENLPRNYQTCSHSTKILEFLRYNNCKNFSFLFFFQAVDKLMPFSPPNCILRAA